VTFPGWEFFPEGAWPAANKTASNMSRGTASSKNAR